MLESRLPNIGVIGAGFVGSALVSGFSLHANIKIHDKHLPGMDSMEEVANQEFIFVCVPTPMRSDGTQNLDVLAEALGEFFQAKPASYHPIVTIKSTVMPGTTRKMARMFDYPYFAMNPEFLTERSARLDFINASRIILGGPDHCTDPLWQLYRLRFPVTPIFQTTWEGAELVKYMANAFFATKVSFLNEFYDICQHLGLDYNGIRNMWLADGRIGNSHTDIPGHDGDRGFGGKCFPKDLAAICHWAQNSLGRPLEVCEAAQSVNKKVRTKQDWKIED